MTFLRYTRRHKYLHPHMLKIEVGPTHTSIVSVCVSVCFFVCSSKLIELLYYSLRDTSRPFPPNVCVCLTKKFLAPTQKSNGKSLWSVM